MVGKMGRFMAMFDWYEPSGDLRCPECESILVEWQSKDGACALFVWREGEAQPVDQRVDEDAKADLAVRASQRLPRQFEIYSYDCGQHVVTAVGACHEGTWDTTELTRLDAK